MIANPVLPGFHPDPSICRVGDDYYLATSTFQWWPAVRLHHSRDLNSWTPVGYAITRKEQLSMLGVEDNAGVWAPCLSWCDGLFYLIFTDVKAWTGPFKDAHNYLITAPSIEGPWSDPVYLNSSGFDPSLFHDDDGRKWLLNMLWDHRPGQNPFAGILLQEFDAETGALVGEARNIFDGTSLGLVEGPHLYRKDNWYYLLTAEGGTGWDHAATVARSRDIAGPYEVMPGNPLITCRHDMMLPLQRAGHGSFVQTSDGDWYFAHLTGRPVFPERRCILGRETAIQAIEWDTDGWPRLRGGGNTPQQEVETPRLEEQAFSVDARTVDFFDSFDAPSLDNTFNTLRSPADDSWLSLTERRGFLRLRGRESLYSKHSQSLIARRINHLHLAASCVLEFSPASFQQMAGLIFFYDTGNYHYLFVSNNRAGRCLNIFSCEGGRSVSYPGVECFLSPGPLFLKGRIEDGELRFYFGATDSKWQSIGPVLDATVLSDEYKSDGKFTGAFVGLCAQDLSGRRCVADFDWFRVENQLPAHPQNLPKELSCLNRP